MRQAALRGIRNAVARVSKFLEPKSIAPLSFDINMPWGRGFVDRICVDPCGLIRIEGWWEGVFEDETLPVVCLDRIQIPLLQHFRFTRPDVRTGLALEYLVPDTLVETPTTLEVTISRRNFRFESSFTF